MQPAPWAAGTGQHRAHGAAKDDQGRGRLQNLAQVAAFDQQSGHDAGDGQNNSANTALIHETLLENSCAENGIHLFGVRFLDSALAGNVQAGQRNDLLLIALPFSYGSDRLATEASRRAR
jgi:hypothetical protein